MKLNKQQQAAVEAPDGPALVLAGAGTGKTRVIVERMAWLVEERAIDPRHILALTFTNKAAAEMRERFARRLERPRVDTWLGTFHSFGLYLLRREGIRVGLPQYFTIFDDADQLALMKRLVKALPPNLEPVSPREALTWISQLKQEVQAPDPEEEPEDAAEETYHILWNQYHDHLAKAGAADFDDLLVKLVHLLEKHPDVREKYQRRYRYVLVDEYQDTNRAQYLIARYLSEAHGNLFVVGDEDQSIYSWRGADINNILDFANDFEDASVHRLEENYRSTTPILDAANSVVKNNINRLGKTLRAKSNGDRVRFYLASSAEDEATFIVDDFAKRGISPADVAVLYRTNGQARILEEAFRKKGTPYTIVGGIKFYQRKEIKDIVAYLRLLVNPSDDEALRRIINVPTRGIGNTTLRQFEEYAAARKCPILQVLRDVEMDETLSSRARKAAATFVQLIDDLNHTAKTENVEDTVEALLKTVGYRAYVEASDEKDFRTRIEIIDEFVAGCTTYDKTTKGTLADFLQDMALESDIDTYDSNEPVATLMTCHSAKGLEFPTVYLAGMEEGLLPFLREYDDYDEDVEEERRLCYVAMTRAEKELTLTAARSRMIYGRTHDMRERSRFIDEIGTDRLEIIGASQKKKKAKAATPAPDVHNETIKSGTKVRHAKFGPGYIMYTSGTGEKMKARVRFNTGRTALLMLSKAPIEILKG